MKKSLFSILYMFLITLCFTSIVSGVKLLNEERIATNQRLKLQGIILRVLQLAPRENLSGEAVMKLFQARVKEVQVKTRPVYLGYESDGRTLKGVAIPVGGPGFWGPISGMVAVDPEGSKIIGIAFYKHSETPGLGARMTENWFTDQFLGLNLHPIEGNQKIFYLKPQGSGKAPHELDAITGATGTSRGIEAFLNRDLDDFLKNLLHAISRNVS